MDVFGGRVVDVDVIHEVETSFLEYAYSVINSRALPDARDGLKPVQRRILFALVEGGVKADSQHVKCARVVGQVISMLHPHGDGTIYDALVRMAQPWSMRLPLVDGRGNFGSLDAGAAAMRYTECRMDHAAAAMTAGLDEGTVDFRANYDGTESEPVVLPSAFPNLLVNGASGIAVGIATNIPPHNLAEVVVALKQLLRDPDIGLDQIMRYLPGPDFPTGGKIIDLDGVRAAYATGRGMFRVRATTRIEKTSPRRQAIVVTELPYMVGPERIVEQIKKGVDDRKLTGIADVKDLTDHAHGTRLVIEVKTGINPEALLEQLFKHTELEDSFVVNAVALVDGQPRLLSLKELLQVYLDHRIEVTQRRISFLMRQATDRLHVVRGLIIARAHIDDVIAILRSSEGVAEAGDRLIRAFELDETQTNHVLDMQGHNLTRISTIELQKEVEELTRRIGKLQMIACSRRLLKNLVGVELERASKKLGEPRRSQLMVRSPTPTLPKSVQDAEIDERLARYMDANVHRMWMAIVSSCPDVRSLPLRGPLPRIVEAGCLYTVLEGDEQICAALAPSLLEAWSTVKSGESGDPLRARAVWIPGSQDTIIRRSPLLSFDPGMSALRAGRPLEIIDPTQLRSAPTIGGVYRIHLIGDDGFPEIYVGRTSNFRRRPGRHHVTAGRTWGSSAGQVTRIDLLPAKKPAPGHAWAAVDLDVAEEKHITRARRREILEGGPRVLNITRGRNGPPSGNGTRLFLWPPS